MRELFFSVVSVAFSCIDIAQAIKKEVRLTIFGRMVSKELLKELKNRCI